MDFLNQFPETSTPKDNTSLLSFADKTDQKGDLPFSFGTQSSDGVEISFLNQMKSQEGESFQIDDNEKNIGGLNYLKTIYEVPESSNNFLNSNDDFPLQNPLSCQIGLDFIREGSQGGDDNFDFAGFQSTEKKENEQINVDINNLFKNQTSPNGTAKSDSKIMDKNIINDDKILNVNSMNNNVIKNNMSGNNSSKSNKENVNLNLNMNLVNKKYNNGLNVNIEGSVKTGENNNINMNINNKPVEENINLNNINSDIDLNKNINTNFNKIPSYPNQKKNINIKPSSRSNPNISQRQGKNINNNNATSPMIMINKNNPNINDVNNYINNQNDNFFNPSLNQMQNISNANKNNNNQDNNVIPQFQNIGNIVIKQKMPIEKKNILDDIDKIVSLNMPLKKENKQNNKNSINNNNNNINNLPSDISEMFSSSTLIGKRKEIEPKDKDLNNIDNLLNFTKESMSSYNSIPSANPKSIINNNQIPIMNIGNNNNHNNLNNPLLFQNKQQGSNSNVLMKSLKGDSFDKKSQVIKLNKNDISNNQINEDEKDNKNVPSKLEMNQKYNELVVRLNKIREQAKEYRNLGNYFSQLISANENYEFVFPNVIKKLLEVYSQRSENMMRLMKIKNNKMNEMNNEFDEEVRKYSLAFPEQI